jgi:hypothetical protein
MMRSRWLGVILTLAGCSEGDIEQRFPLAGCGSLVFQGDIILEVNEHSAAQLVARGSLQALQSLQMDASDTAIRIAADTDALQVDLMCPGTVGMQLIGNVAAIDQRSNPQYHKLALYGDAQFHADRISGDHLDLRGAGASAISIDHLMADAAHVFASGTARIAIGGEVLRLTVEASGSSAVDTQDLNGQEVSVSLGGASRTVAHASAHLSGAMKQNAKLAYSGAPDVDVTTQDSAEIERK